MPHHHCGHVSVEIAIALSLKYVRQLQNSHSVVFIRKSTGSQIRKLDSIHFNYHTPYYCTTPWYEELSSNIKITSASPFKRNKN
eukprot:scaffold5865_cov186-Amphora_coffeaeformis.AAC.4